jgi:Rod binding domain-containing protein
MNIMDQIDLTLTNSVLPDSTKKTDNLLDAQKEQFAKDFESVFIEKLLDEMKNTIGDWGFEQDGASKQVQGLFWMNLARDVSKNGGMGMWKDIYQSLDQTETKANDTQLLDNQL